jgi:ribonuclease P protein component
VVGSAAKRNLLKRRVRTMLAGAIASTKESTVYVAHAKKGSSAAAFEELNIDILDLLARTRPSR